MTKEQAMIRTIGTLAKENDELQAEIGRLRQALEQQSDDCVSRQAVKEGMTKYGFRAPDMTITEFIEDELPSVTPV